MHTVVSCDVGQRLKCNAQGIVGPYGRTFYVSKSAVYIWVHEGRYSDDGDTRVDDAPAVVYRMPLDGSTPGALRVHGAPTDQFSFKEADDKLHVLVRSEGGGDWMGSPEASAGDVALMSVPVDGISANVGTVRKAAYTSLPRPSEDYGFQNRFIGNHVVYGAGSGWGDPDEATERRAYFHRYRGGDATTTSLPLRHGVDRLEALGKHAVVIGTDGENLHFSSVDLSGGPKIHSRFVQQAANQGETRSHGFFFKPSGDKSGMLGLPIRGGSAPGSAHLDHGSASVLFLNVSDLKLKRMGALAALSRNQDDNCEMSCVDWYGNARPLFYKGRVFALMGYELVEGKVNDGRIEERARVNFLTKLTRKRTAKVAN